MSEEVCTAMCGRRGWADQCVCLRVWVCVSACLGVDYMAPWVLSQPAHQTRPFPITWA